MFVSSIPTEKMSGGEVVQGAEHVVPTEAPHHGPGAARSCTRGGTGGSNRGPATRTTAPPTVCEILTKASGTGETAKKWSPT